MTQHNQHSHHSPHTCNYIFDIAVHRQVVDGSATEESGEAREIVPATEQPEQQSEFVIASAAEMVEHVLAGIGGNASSAALRTLVKDRARRLFDAAVPSVGFEFTGRAVPVDGGELPTFRMAPTFRVRRDVWDWLSSGYWTGE